MKFGIKSFSTSLTLKPLRQSMLSCHIDMLRIPSNLGHSTSRGMRAYNEDRYCIGLLNIPLQTSTTGIFNKEIHISNQCPPIDHLMFAFAVFDGHGGDECSNYLKMNLFNNIETARLNPLTFKNMKSFWSQNIGGYWKRWNRKLDQIIIKLCFNSNSNSNSNVKLNSKSDHQLFDLIYNETQNKHLTHWQLIKLRLWLAHLNTDQYFLEWENETNSHIQNKMKLVRSGSTSTSSFIYPLEWPKDSPNRHFYEEGVVSRLLISHIGDTHAILCDKNGLACPLTRDHHPSNPTEADRLRKFSAGLVMTDSFGEERFLNFANTRAFGDLSGKDSGISAEPEFSDFIIGSSNAIEQYKKNHERELKDNNVIDFGGDEGFIVLVSDGVTNLLSDQEIVDLVMTTYNNKGVSKGTPQSACNEVIGFVECINGDDNATCLVIRLQGWGKWPNIDRTGSLREDKMMMMRNGSKLY